MPLTEIDSVFNDEGPGLIETVGSHLERIDRDLERGQRLRQPLVRILDALERSLVEALGSGASVLTPRRPWQCAELLAHGVGEVGAFGVVPSPFATPFAEGAGCLRRVLHEVLQSPRDEIA